MVYGRHGGSMGITIMKTLLIILCILLTPLLVEARMNVVVCGGGVATAACTTQASPTDMETFGASAYNIGTAAGNRYVASRFVAGESTNICQICVYLKSSTGTSPTFSITAYIFSDTGAEEYKPDAVVASGTFETRDMTGVLDGDYDWYCWTGGNAAVTSGTAYHVALYTSGTDGTNITYWGYDSSCTTERVHRGTTTPAWTNESTTYCTMTKLYK